MTQGESSQGGKTATATNLRARPLPAWIGGLLAVAFPVGVLGTVNAVPGTLPASTLASLALLTLIGSALSLLVTRPFSVRRDQTKEERVEPVFGKPPVLKPPVPDLSSITSLSHELRTPLNGVLGLAGLLLDDDLTPAQRNHVHAIRQSGQTLAALVDEVLDHSRMDADGIDIMETECDPRAILREVTELLALRAHTKNLGLGAVVSDSVPLTLHLDAARLRQVLTNLIGNAVKYTQTGGIAVECRWLGEADTLDGELEIVISDTGNGIAPENHARIFEVFERAPASGGAGSGLGLAIVRRTVDAMGGEINVKSAPGQGSIFTVLLPCRIGQAAVASPRPLEGQSVAVSLPCPYERAMIAAMCARLGAATDVASEDADIVLTARSEDGVPPDAAAPHIALLSLTERTEPEKLRQQGYAGYLTRPVREESLLARIALSRSTPRASTRTAAPDADKLPRTQNPKRILLAEDDPISAMLLVAMLQRMGHEAQHVGDGRAALAALRDPANRFDAILLDLELPEMSGREVAVKARAEGLDLPIVAVSASNAADVDADGFAAHFEKPIDPKRLAVTLEGLAARSAA
ncbi:ATP-binding protein [Tepidamorphus sp. 3E244]|uniref:ATP-binding protein n=1 Tax=Tepidamorphus sp. 3E244 TaxID=3385498 RepID=UPI0038FCBAD4